MEEENQSFEQSESPEQAGLQASQPEEVKPKKKHWWIWLTIIILIILLGILIIW